MAEIDLPLPRLGETMEEGRIITWLKQPGDKFKRGEILLEVETDKTVVEVPALQDGVMVRHLAGEADLIPVDAPIARIEIANAFEKPATKAPSPEAREGWGGGDGASARRDLRTKEQPPPRPSPNLGEGEYLRASPRARRLARDRGIDLAALTGSGRNG